MLAGARIALDRGLPVTLIDGGEALATRAPYGTVADLLEAERITLGPLDQVEPAAGAPVSAGTVVRVTRIAEREETVRETGPFPVRYIADPNLDRGVQIVVSPGQPAISASTYRVRTVDGREVERVLIASVEVSGPVEEVRRSGVRRRPAGRRSRPAPPGRLVREPVQPERGQPIRRVGTLPVHARDLGGEQRARGIRRRQRVRPRGCGERGGVDVRARLGRPVDL